MPPEAGSAARVLVVEDERALRALLARFLRSAGFDCAEAATVDEALAALDGTPFTRREVLETVARAQTRARAGQG